MSDTKMHSEKSKVICVNVNEETLKILSFIKNKSEFIREAIKDKFLYEKFREEYMNLKEQVEKLKAENEKIKTEKKTKTKKTDEYEKKIKEKEITIEKPEKTIEKQKEESKNLPEEIEKARIKLSYFTQKEKEYEEKERVGKVTEKVREIKKEEKAAEQINLPKIPEKTDILIKQKEEEYEDMIKSIKKENAVVKDEPAKEPDKEIFEQKIFEDDTYKKIFKFKEDKIKDTKENTGEVIEKPDNNKEEENKLENIIRYPEQKEKATELINLPKIAEKNEVMLKQKQDEYTDIIKGMKEGCAVTAEKPKELKKEKNEVENIEPEKTTTEKKKIIQEPDKKISEDNIIKDTTEKRTDVVEKSKEIRKEEKATEPVNLPKIAEKNEVMLKQKQDEYTNITKSIKEKIMVNVEKPKEVKEDENEFEEVKMAGSRKISEADLIKGAKEIYNKYKKHGKSAIKITEKYLQKRGVTETNKIIEEVIKNNK